jgi:hypothetical protein
MKAVHRGHDIDVHREKSMGGDMLLYYSIFRQSDGYECASGFSTGSDTVKDFMDMMKERIDAELADPQPWGTGDWPTDFTNDATAESK